MLGSSIGRGLKAMLEARNALSSEKLIKQEMHNIGKSEYTRKKHLGAIKVISKIDERDREIAFGGSLIGMGATPVLINQALKIMPKIKSPVLTGLMTLATAAGTTYGAIRLPQLLYLNRLKGSGDIKRAIEIYDEKLLKKVERKIKASKSYIDRADRVERLGIDKKILEV